MRKKEKERFLRMNFTEKELAIRDRLYKARKNARFKIRITEEHYDRKRKHAEHNPPYHDYLSYFSDYPEEGRYIDTVYFSTPAEFDDVVKLYEGEFYELFDLASGDRIGYGCFDPDSPVEEIRRYEKCEGVCELCFWHGMIYGEIETENREYKCYKEEAK